MGAETRVRKSFPGRRFVHAVLFAAAGIFGLPGNSTGQDGPPAREEAITAVEVDAAGGAFLADGTLALANGAELVLIGLDVGLGLAPATKALLREMRSLQETRGPWRVEAAARDRYSRLSGRVETADGEWIQERLLRLGLARFAGGVAGRRDRTVLLEAEQAARAAGRGVWRNPRYAMRQAEDPDAIYNGFQIVEGRVRAVGRGDGVVFLNFGEDWRQDFTAGITTRLAPEDLPTAEGGAPLSLYDLEGRLIRVRGMVRRYNGPYMEIAGADQIEFPPEGRADPVRLRSAGPSDPRPASGSTL